MQGAGRQQAGLLTLLGTSGLGLDVGPDALDLVGLARLDRALELVVERGGFLGRLALPVLPAIEGRQARQGGDQQPG